jgi:hypothetical protein
MFSNRTSKVSWEWFSANTGPETFEFADAASAGCRFIRVEALQAGTIDDVDFVCRAVLVQGQWT